MRTARLKTTLPLLLFIALVFFLYRGVFVNPRILPSALIGKPVPHFLLPSLTHPARTFTQKDLNGHLSLVNVWATWCMVCKVEHPVLMAIAKTHTLPLYSLDYKDNKQGAQAWLKTEGDPYQLTGFDVRGNTAINFGVYGTPETFLVDTHGVIRFKHVGAMTMAVWHNQFVPLIQKLRLKKVA